MKRLTEMDDLGNWGLKGLRWQQLHVGQTITKEVHEKLYGALYKLKDYEETGLSPEEVERVDTFVGSQVEHILLELQKERGKHRWIPVEERLPEDNNEDFYDSVIVTLDSGRVAEGCYRKADKEWWVDAPDGQHFSENQTGHVVAWQSLPKPYKGEYDE